MKLTPCSGQKPCTKYTDKAGQSTFFTTRKSDMAEMQKKMAAALAAVNAYLQEEQARASSESHTCTFRQAPIIQSNLWGQSGRQEMMSMRRLIQMRAFDRCR